MSYPNNYSHRPLTSISSGVQESRKMDRTRDICVPRFRCIPLHSKQIKMPKEVEVHSGFAARQSAHCWLPRTAELRSCSSADWLGSVKARSLMGIGIRSRRVEIGLLLWLRRSATLSAKAEKSGVHWCMRFP